MKKEITFYIIVILIILTAFILLAFDLDKKAYEKLYEWNEKYIKNNNPSENNPSDSENTNSDSNQGSSSGSGSSGGTSSSTETPEEKPLPEDLETIGCGFYFQEYGICTGTCSKGTCVSEGRSCYCKTS